MEFDIMTGSANSTWADTAHLATTVAAAGFSGICFTETSQVPWMQIAAASMAAPELFFSTGVAVAFPRSPMISAAVAYEMAGNTNGRFRLGLGSQVKAHVTRRYSAEFDRPAARMRDYVLAVKACVRAFNRVEPLAHHGEFYDLTLLPREWSPTPHDYAVQVDISAVGPVMTRIAGEVADGVHVHPLHSMPYIENRLLPSVREGAAATGRTMSDIDLIVPVFACPGDTPEQRAPYVERARQQIAFYGSTPNYAFQFDDLGFDGTTERIRQMMKSGDVGSVGSLISDEMLAHYAVVAPWDELADRLLDRYRGIAARLVMYMGSAAMRSDPNEAGRWGEVARAVRVAS